MSNVIHFFVMGWATELTDDVQGVSKVVLIEYNVIVEVTEGRGYHYLVVNNTFTGSLFDLFHVQNLVNLFAKFVIMGHHKRQKRLK